MDAAKSMFSLQTKIALLVCTVVALALLVANILITHSVSADIENSIGENAADIARIVARSSVVIEGLTGKRDEKDIRDFASEISKATNVEYIVVMDMSGIRKSHPTASLIGEHFVGGDEIAVLKEGREYTSIAKGTLGPALRAFSPVFGPDGRQVGAVAVGILLGNVQQSIAQSQAIIYFATGIGLLIGVAGALLLARSIKKTMFGLEPFAIAKLLEERSAMLHSVREGILAIEKNSRITLVNEEAMRIFNLAGIEQDLVGKPVNDYIANSRLTEVLDTGKVELDQEQDINGVAILTNRMPIMVNGQIVGAIATFRDKSEIKHLADRLTGVSNYAEALRAQAHEFMNKLHVILGMARMGCYDEISPYIAGIAKHYQAEVGFVARRIKDPVLAGFLLGKLSRAREMGIDFALAEESFLPRSSSPDISHELITIIGNLVDNAMDAVAEASEKRVTLHIEQDCGVVTIEVVDTGIGISADAVTKMFEKGYSTKASDRGLGLFLVQRSVSKLGGDIAVSSGSGQGARFQVELPYHSEGDEI